MNNDNASQFNERRLLSYGVKVGLECHLYLNKVNTKLFCSCRLPNDNDLPNSVTCVTCLGHPGSKPVLNKSALFHAVKLALATNCTINKEIIFSRKTYFYPDMSKNYQITQYEVPLGFDGYVIVGDKKIEIKRVHLEEDPAALVHPNGLGKSSYVLVDYNRAGMPLCEIVTEPVIESPEESREFLKKLIGVVNYLGIYDPDISTVKVDANISISETDYTRVEVKNISGFKEVERALNYEIQRQKIEKKVIPETRAWDTEKGITLALRSKESEEDYGYIADTDLVRIELDADLINSIRKEIPELAHERVKRYITEFKLDKKDAEVIASEHLLAVLFEKVAREVDPLLAARWLRRELLRVLNYNNKELKDLEIDEKHLIELLTLVETKKVTEDNAKRILEKLIEKPFNVKEYIEKEGIKVLSNESELREICQNAIKENQKAVEDYKKGEEKALNYIIGQVMAKTKGAADNKIIRKIITNLIGGNL